MGTEFGFALSNVSFSSFIANGSAGVTGNCAGVGHTIPTIMSNIMVSSYYGAHTIAYLEYPPSAITVTSATEFPPSAMSSNMTTLSDGIYVVQLSPDWGSNSTIHAYTYTAYQAFDKNTTNFYQSVTYPAAYNSVTFDGSYTYSNSTSYLQNATSTTNNGEYLQLKMPDLVVLTSYSISANSTSWGPPRDFVLLGSLDGTNWNWIAESSNQTSWSNNETRNFAITSFAINPYSYYQIIVNSITAAQSTTLEIGEVRFYGYKFNSLSDGIYVPSWYPGNSVSTTAGSAVYNAFDKGNGTWFEPNISEYNNTTGTYVGTFFTNYSSNGSSFTKGGEALQLQMPNAILLAKYSVTSRPSYPNRAPKSLMILGSTNGSNWYWLDEQTGQTWLSGGETKTFRLTGTPSLYYSYFRLVTYSIGADSILNITECKLFAVA